MKKHIFSIKTQLIATFVPIFLILFLAISSTAIALYYSNLIKYMDSQIQGQSFQILNNYESYFDSVIMTSNAIEKKIDNIDVNIEKVRVNEYFDDLKSSRQEILSLALYDASNDGKLLVSNSNYEGEKEGSIYLNWYKSALENPLLNNFSAIEELDNTQHGFILSKKMKYSTLEKEAILKINYDFTKILNSMSLTDLGKGGHITIYDNDYNLIYSSNSVSENEITVVKETILGSKIVYIDNISFSLFLSTISKTRWKLAIFINYQNISNLMRQYFFIVLSVGIVLAIVYIIALYFMASKITKPLKVLKEEMSKIEILADNKDIKSNFNSNLEVKELSESFNQMQDRIEFLTKQIIKEEEEKNKSELKALQNQINPHFLYNTLDSILYLIERNENQKAEQMIISLSKFFRISISKGQNIIPLEKEVEHASYYLAIQKIRYGTTFDYEVKVDKDLYKYSVIKLILQPIVENSLLHGLQEINGKNDGKIIIEAKIDGEFLRFDIIDNGYGILPEKVEEIYKNLKDDSIKSSVGLKNVYQRIKIYYGEKAELKIFTELDKGTDIALFLPLERLNTDEKI